MVTRSNGARRRQAGYTYIELVVVLLICSVLGAAAVPRYANALCQFRVGAAAQRLAADIAFTQRQALVRSKSQSLQFTPNGNPGIPNSYAMSTVNYVNFATAGATVDLSLEPYKATIASATFGPGTTLSFDIYGKPIQGGSVVLACGSYQKTVNVEATTGRVTIP